VDGLLAESHFQQALINTSFVRERERESEREREGENVCRIFSQGTQCTNKAVHDVKSID